MNELELNDLERKSAAWQKVEKYCERQIAKLHRINEGNLNTEDTYKLRGRIQELRKLRNVLCPDKLDVPETPVPYQS